MHAENKICKSARLMFFAIRGMLCFLFKDASVGGTSKTEAAVVHGQFVPCWYVGTRENWIFAAFVLLKKFAFLSCVIIVKVLCMYVAGGLVFIAQGVLCMNEYEHMN